MKAKEMFEKLYFKQDLLPVDIIRYTLGNLVLYFEGYRYYFNRNEKLSYFKPVLMTAKLHLAIHQQMLELGWLDE